MKEPLVNNTNSLPKYKTLYNFYKEGICTFQFAPGTRIDSINEIQNRFEVSRETAKQVLSMLCDDGYIKKVPGKGSFVLELNAKKSHWAVVLPFVSAQIEPLLFHLRKVALSHEKEFSYFLSYNQASEEKTQVGRLIHEGYQAVIVVPVSDESENAEYFSRLRSGATQVILANHTMTGASGQYVIQSYDLGVQRALDYLIKRKRGNILFVCDELLVKEDLVQELMEQTFLTYCEANNRKGYLLSDVRQLSEYEFDEKDIEGVFCSNDILAIQTIGLLKEKGLSIPDNVALVSYGNTDLARYFTPAITSIDAHQNEMASVIGNIITNRTRDDIGKQHIVQPTLKIRQT